MEGTDRRTVPDISVSEGLPPWSGRKPVPDFGEPDAFDLSYIGLMLPLIELRIFQAGSGEGQPGKLEYCRFYGGRDDPASCRFWHAGAIASLPAEFPWRSLHGSLRRDGIEATGFEYGDGTLVYMSPYHNWEDPRAIEDARRVLAAAGIPEGGAYDG